MNDENVLTLLRTEAGDNAPAMSLEYADVVRRGRRRRTMVRAAQVGGVVAACTALTLGGVWVADLRDSSSLEPTNVGPGYDPEAMPGLLRDAVAAQTPASAPAIDLDVEAWGQSSGMEDEPLPRDRWDEATGWTADWGDNGDPHQLYVEASGGVGSETEGNVQKNCDADLADKVVVDCHVTSLGDGLVAQYEVYAQKPWGEMWKAVNPENPRVDKDQLWFAVGVSVFHPNGDGFRVKAEETVKAPSFEAAEAELIFGEDRLERIAGSSSLYVPDIMSD